MNVPSFGRMTPPSELAPGAWFMFARQNGVHLCMTVQRNAEGPGTDFGFIDLARFLPEPNIEPHFVDVALARWLPTVLELRNIEIDVPLDVTCIKPDASSADDLWRPGALLISANDYRVIVANRDDKQGWAMPSLINGSMHWMHADQSTALISHWRLMQRVGENDVRELCSIRL